jgi:uncharacterized Zn-finger protein
MKPHFNSLWIHPPPEEEETVGTWLDRLSRLNNLHFGVFLEHVKQLARSNSFYKALNILTLYPVEKLEELENEFNEKFWDEPTKCPIKNCVHENELPSNILKHLWGKHDLGVTWYHCPKCKRKFKAPRYLKTHLAKGHGINSTIFRCGIDDCTYKTLDKKDLKRHQRYKHDVNVKWHYCPESNCGHKSKSKPDLTKHLADIHGIGGKVHECPFEGCTYANTQKGNLNRHVRDIHDMNAPLYYCDHPDCSFSTKNKGYIKTHKKRIHGIGLVLFPCPFETCDYKGKRKGDVTDHVKKVHGDGVNRCPNCTFTSIFKRGLKDHLKDDHGIRKGIKSLKNFPGETMSIE